MYNSKAKIVYLAMTFINALCVAFGCFGSIFLMRYLHLLRPLALRQVNVYYVLVVISFMIAFVYYYPYEEIYKKRFIRNVLLILRQNLYFAVCMAVTMMITRNSMMESRFVYVSFFLMNVGSTLVVTCIFKHYILKGFRLGTQGILVGIVTTEKWAEPALRTIWGHWNRRIQGLCILDKDMKGEKVSHIEINANEEDLLDWVKRDMLDEVVLYVDYFDNINRDKIKVLMDTLLEMGLTVHLNLISDKDFPECDSMVTMLNDQPFLTVCHNILDYRQIVIKRLIDIVGGLVGCILSAPIILLVAIPLCLESKGGLFFKQKRVGLNGRYFYIYKLRSMYPDAEERLKELQSQNEMQGLMFKMENDPRITKVGKFIRKYSIDELPQFYNVLKGDMSLVGTRPPTKNEFIQYEGHHKRRLSMKPGITGMWQVSGRNNITDFDEVVAMDLQYIDQWSLMLDFKILLKTVKVVLAKEGAV